MTNDEKETLLAQLELAYRQLISGSSVSSVEKNGQQISYYKANVEALYREIISLKSELGQTVTRRLGPVGFTL